MTIAIYSPGMLFNGDFHFRLGHGAPVRFLPHIDHYPMCAVSF
jgi:hypothetical protein